jgi:rubrerythrin
MFTRIDFSTLTLMDALDLAHLIEVEAFRRYTLFAAQLGQRGPGEPADVFRSMAANEEKHGEQLAGRRQLLFGDAPARVTLDDLFDVEAPDVGSARWNMSPSEAFAVALAAERKAYAFYDAALPSVRQPEVKALFEDLRDEEAEHVRMVEQLIAQLPPEAAIGLEDLDAD